MRRTIARTKSLFCCLVFLVAPYIARAGIRSSFMLDYSAWHATDIVVATEGDAVDGELSILEIWKGNLSPGNVLNVDALHALTDETGRTVKTFWPSKDENEPPVVVSGQKILLFLKRGSSGTANEAQSPPIEWQPASLFDDMKTSLVWIEGRNTYAFRQVTNPGPTVLIQQDQSDGDMKKRVTELSEIQESLARIAAASDAGERANMAARYAKSDVRDIRNEAFRILADCKMPAAPILTRMLADESNANQYGEIVDALAAAGGSELAPEFVRLVDDELGYWKVKAPSLKIGWWNDTSLESPEMAALRNRYVKILHVFYGLRQMKFARSWSSVQSFRDYWRSLPQLEDKSGLDKMSEACDAVLEALNQNESGAKQKDQLQDPLK